MHVSQLCRAAAVASVLLSAFFVTGCPTIPKNGALLSGKLTEGIERNQTETEKIITALADTQRAILSEHWESIYAKVEAGYRDRNGLAADAALTETHRLEIAAVAAKTHYDLRDQIAAKENELKSATRANSAQLVGINETIQSYLLSVEKLDAARTTVTDRIGKITGVDFASLKGLAETLIKTANPFQQ